MIYVLQFSCAALLASGFVGFFAAAFLLMMGGSDTDKLGYVMTFAAVTFVVGYWMMRWIA